jgi:hypothetical protein
MKATYISTRRPTTDLVASARRMPSSNCGCAWPVIFKSQFVRLDGLSCGIHRVYVGAASYCLYVTVKATNCYINCAASINCHIVMNERRDSERALTVGDSTAVAKAAGCQLSELT